MPIQLVDEAAYLQPLVLRKRRGIKPWAGDNDHPQCRDLPFRLRKRCDHPTQQMFADTRAADRDDADLLIVSIAELMPQPCRGRRSQLDRTR